MCEKFTEESHWLDAEYGRSPNNGCTLHQWEHPFQQSVPHMVLRPLLHALSRQRVSFMLQDSGSLQASWPSDLLFWSDLTSWQKKTFCTQTFKEYPETDSLWTVWRVEPSQQVIICARTEAGDLRLDNACSQWGNIFIIIAWALKKSLWKHHTAPAIHSSKPCESSVFLRRSGGAQRLGLDLLLFAEVL